MGSAGLDHNTNNNNVNDNNCRVPMVTSETVSVSRRVEGNGKHLFIVVECRDENRGSQITRSKKFRCSDRGFEDPDAISRALRFGFLTDGLVAFRNFLFKNRNEGCSDTGRKRSSLYVCLRRNGVNNLRFAAAVARAENGVIRCVSFGGSESSDDDEEAIGKALGFIRGRDFGNWAKRLSQVEVSSPCGVSRRVCRHCGQQHQDAQPEKQIQEDYTCSACQKGEREEITIIRINEQVECSAIPLEQIWTDSKSAELTRGHTICCICGCEDNEKFEPMIRPCNCNGGSVVAHQSCISASVATSRIGSKQSPASCKVCGGRGTLIVDGLHIDAQTRTGSAEEGFTKPTCSNSSSRKSSKSFTQNSRGVKRASSELTNGGVGKTELFENNQPSLKSLKEESGRKAVQDLIKEDLTTSDSEKLGVPLPARRFNDAVASVPIKKRRIPLVRSPSPPPPSPLFQSSSPDHAVSRPLPVSDQEQGLLNAWGQQQGMDIAGDCLQEKSAKVVDGTLNEIIEKHENSRSLVIPFLEDAISNADLSGISRLQMADCMGKPGEIAYSLEDRVSRAEFAELEDAKSASVRLKDDSLENQQDGEACRYAQNREKDSKNQAPMQNSDQSPVSGNKSNVSEPSPGCNTPTEFKDHVTCNEMKESTELALKCNSNTGRDVNQSEMTDCRKLASQLGESSVQTSASLLKDRERKEKGLLLRLDSGYFNDDRSHWDLNTPMDSWEQQPEVQSTDPGLDFTGQSLAGTTNNKKPDHLDGIQVQILVAEVVCDTGKPEQDMLSKGFHAQSTNELNPSEGLAFQKDVELDTSLSLQPDATFSCRPATYQKMNDAFISKSTLPLEESIAEKGLNLSMAPLEGPYDSANVVSCTEAEDSRQQGEKHLDDVPETEHLSDSDKEPDSMVIESKLVACDKTEFSSALKQDLEPLKGNIEVVDNSSAKETFNGLETIQACFDVQKHSLSSPAGDVQLTRTMNECRIVYDANIATISKVDASELVEDTNTKREKSASPEVPLDKQSVEYAAETAYSGDYEYDDEDEAVSDTEKEFIEQSENEVRDEDEEYRETEPHDWVEEDAGEEMEVEHVDYGDSDCRDADDLGMEPEDRAKDMECMDVEDIKHERNWHDAQQAEMEEKGGDIHQDLHDTRFGDPVQVRQVEGGDTKPDETEAAGRDVENSNEKYKHKGDDTEFKSAELLSENKGWEVERNHNLNQHENATKLSKGKYPTSSRQKSSGWDQLPEGFENAEEALKAVQDIINKRGRGAGWVPGGRMGPVSARGPSSRMDGGFGERLSSEDLIHGKEGFYTRERDGSLHMSPRFASRKPARGRIVGRGGPSRGMHSRGRGDPWADGDWGSSRHHSPPGYYGGEVGFGPHVSANAAAVSAAKVESSGFVVNLDGTLTKVGRGGMRGRRGRGALMGRVPPIDIEENMNFGMHLSMGPGGMSMLPDTGMNMGRGKAVGIDPDRIDAGGRVGRERYRGSSFGNSRWDYSMGDSPRRSMHSMDHHLTERNRSFSPPLGTRLTSHVRSHTQSRSRSRTRSPRLRFSPRISSGRGTAHRRHSRSPPALRSEARMVRLKSPLFHRVSSLGHKMSFSSRTQRSPPQASKWSNGRRYEDHFRDSDYKRPFSRSGSPSRRMSPRGLLESGLMESPVRLKHGNYSRPVYSSRSAEFGSDSRRFKRDVNEDVRLKQSDSSRRPVEVGGADARRFRHQNNEIDCQVHSSRTKDAGTSREQGRGDPNSR
eukprot:Gb_37342 [translate_table: standard]